MFTRECPKCGRILTHTTKGNCETARKKETLCRSCCQDNNGTKNPMFGKSLYSVWLKKYGKVDADKRLEEYGNNRKGKKLNLSVEGAENRKHFGAKNHVFGKSVEQIVLEKYGEDEGTKRITATRKKMSVNMSGKNNPMFGKPSPTGSGNGWSGWYNGHYFRSLLELSYLKYLIDNDIKFESAECKKHSINYVDSITLNDRTYFPDFYLIDTKEVIEIKPKKLLKVIKNVDKYNAAKRKLKKKFRIVTEDDVEKLDESEIARLHDDGEIRFINRYEQKYQERRNTK